MTRQEVLDVLEAAIAAWSAPATPPSLRALTVWQPWATLIANGRKRNEYRSRPTAWRGPVLIHAGIEWAAGIEVGPPDSVYPLGVVVAIVRIADCRGGGRMPYSWRLDDVTPLPHVHLRGRQGLWIPKLREIDMVKRALLDG